MARTTITTDGIITYRTTLMTWARAKAFAKCIATNANFCDVELLPSAKAKGDQYYIQFRPVNVERQLDMYQAEWNKNAQRAEVEGGDFIYWDCAEQRGLSFVFNPKSGQVYEMHQGTCQCPQMTYRCSGAALHCKHMIEKDRRLANGTYPDADKTTPSSPLAGKEETREERRARVLKMMENDF
jgi:hypothetical protein